MKISINSHHIAVFFFAILPLAVAGTIAARLALPEKEATAFLNEDPAPYAAKTADSGLLWTLDYLNVVKLGNRTRFSLADLAARPLRDAPDAPGFLYFSGAGTGGLSSAEVYEMRRRIAGGAVAVAEAGIFAEGTTLETETELADIFGVRPTGWSGKYFPELSRTDELPPLLVRNWEREHGPWTLKRGGLVLADAQGRVAVLRDGVDLVSGALTFRSDPRRGVQYGLEREVAYAGWFTVVARSDGTEQIAEFVVGATDRGRTQLDALGIPAAFPAVVRKAGDGYAAFFFAGPFSPQRKPLPRLYPVGIASAMARAPAWLEGPERAFFWKAYVPMISRIFKQAPRTAAVQTETTDPKPYEADSHTLVSRINGKKMEIFSSGKWNPFLVKGVNLGLALPNRWFTEMPRNPNLYLRWFRSISGMNANTIRLYTLAPPEFYLALRDYNQSAPRPLYLMQEIWPDENVPGRNYLDARYAAEYDAEIRFAVDAVHGNAIVGERTGRAWGSYESDVSPWTIAYLVGREMEPEEIETTDRLNRGWTYRGKYLSAPNGSPSEAWAARACDFLTSYEVDRYARQTPTAAVGWPILDPIKHISEWNAQGDPKLEFNDRAEFNMDHIEVETENAAGFFGAYHIYPNYPDFMNNDPQYDRYTDDIGRLRYGGYLREFAQAVNKHPSLVAEFGLANGMATAHVSPDGYHHGGLSEKAAAAGIPRLMRAIVREGYLGGIVFEWIDEWAKKTWTTEPTMIPYEAQVHWHNMIDPEQNYGLIAMEAREPETPLVRFEREGPVSALSAKANAEYLYLDFAVDARTFLASGGRFLIGLDTYDRSRGQYRYTRTSPERAPSGMEFAIDISEGSARLTATPDYNIASFKLYSRPRSDGAFEPVRPLVNKARVRKDGVPIPEIRDERLRMAFGDFSESNANVQSTDTTLRIRIPWNALSVGDPLSLTVLDDPRPFNYLPGRDELKTAKSDGIAVSALLLRDGAIYDALPGQGQAPWIVPPPDIDTEDWRERPKAAYYSLRDLFAELD